MPAPTDKEGVRRFLGMVNYLAKFCPNLSDVGAPLRDLTKSDSVFEWSSIHDACMTKLKDIIQSRHVLALFDPSRPVRVSVDASGRGLGAVLLQHGRPVEFASCSLSETEQRYAQIEKEMLAIQFGLRRFHSYVFAQQVIVETDHKPLLGVKAKSLNDVTPRLQRMLLNCSRYDYALEYKPGKELVLSDTLSRAYLPSASLNDDVDTSGAVHAVYMSLMPKVHNREELAALTGQDGTLQLVMSYVQKGWPKRKNECYPATKPYFGVKDELSIYEGLLFRKQQVVAPVSFRRIALKDVHAGHLGIVKCLERAKSAFYWPGYVRDIRDMVEACSLCQENRNANPRVWLSPSEVPEYPFQKVGTDLFEFRGRSYLLLVDYYSKWPCVEELRGTGSVDVIHALERIFCDFGSPEFLMSDNGPQYKSQDFSQFMIKHGTRHLTSSPTYPQSNGMAERTVQTVKKSLTKMFSDGFSLYDTISALRSTPVCSDLPSPSVLLQARNLRTHLHLTAESLKPQVVTTEKVREKLASHQSQASYNTHGHRPGDTLQPGESVRYRVAGKWVPATVIAHSDRPMSYVLQGPKGRVERNRQHINRSSLGTFHPAPTSQLMRTTSSVTKPISSPSNAASTFPIENSLSHSSDSPSSSSDRTASALSQDNTATDTGVSVSRSGRAIKPVVRYGSWTT